MKFIVTVRILKGDMESSIIQSVNGKKFYITDKNTWDTLSDDLFVVVPMVCDSTRDIKDGELVLDMQHVLYKQNIYSPLTFDSRTMSNTYRYCKIILTGDKLNPTTLRKIVSGKLQDFDPVIYSRANEYSKYNVIHPTYIKCRHEQLRYLMLTTAKINQFDVESLAQIFIEYLDKAYITAVDERSFLKGLNSE